MVTNNKAQQPVQTGLVVQRTSGHDWWEALRVRRAMRSAKQITPPISLFGTGCLPLGEALDSGPALPRGRGAADDKVKPHNDVTYLKVPQINIERGALYLAAAQITPDWQRERERKRRSLLAKWEPLTHSLWQGSYWWNPRWSLKLPGHLIAKLPTVLTTFGSSKTVWDSTMWWTGNYSKLHAFDVALIRTRFCRITFDMTDISFEQTWPCDIECDGKEGGIRGRAPHSARL